MSTEKVKRDGRTMVRNSKDCNRVNVGRRHSAGLYTFTGALSSGGSGGGNTEHTAAT